MKPGWIYVLDPNMTVDGRPVVKIGYTTRTVEQRARELSTGVPGGMTVAYKLRVDNPRQVEGRIHGMLRSHRVSQGAGREFFALTPEEAISRIEGVALEISRERAKEAWSSELHAFKLETGINRREGAAFLLSALFFLACCTILYLVPKWSFGPWAGVIIILLGLYLAGRGTAAVFLFLENRLVERPFGARLEAKREELNRKYPLADIRRELEEWRQRKAAEAGKAA